MPAKAQICAYGNIDIVLSGDIRNAVQIAVRVGMLIIYGGRNYPLLYSFGAYRGFYGSGRAEHVTRHSLG